jgi:LPXTG-site transpeptidase (sortase) family protein
MSQQVGVRTADPGPRRVNRLRVLLVLLLCAMTVAGVLLFIHGLSGKTIPPPATQPLPPSPFNVAPSDVAKLPSIPPLGTPQPGSIEQSCEGLPTGQPVVAIPSLCIFASMVPTQVVNNALVIPTDVHQVGLDTASAALAAEEGTTIVAGHVDNIRQGDGVFYFLHTVQPGADVLVTSLTGQVTKWRVYQVDVVQKTALPADIWTTTGQRRLVLVTCGGPLLHLRSGNTYEDNVLVYATPIA